MTVSPSATTFTFLLLLLSQTLTSASTVAVVSGRGAAAACGIVAGEATQHVRCFRHNRTVSLLPNISFDEISGGRSFLCGLRLGGFSLLCWDARTLWPKHIHRSETVTLTGLTVGDEHVCAREADTGVARCWRGGGPDRGEFSTNQLTFSTITCGGGFVCGVLRNTGNVLCWGTEFESVVGAEIQLGFGNLSVVSLAAGESHACGVTSNGTLVCRGSNESGQSKVPESVNTDSDLSSLALGANFTCAIRRRTGLVACWGDHGMNHGVLGKLSFESIVAGSDFACGLTTSNLSLICWGPGWPNAQGSALPLGTVAPGLCVETPCSACGTYPGSDVLCLGAGKICKPCQVELPFAALLPKQTGNSSVVLSPGSKGESKVMLAFFVIGIIGSFSGLVSIAYCVWMGIAQRKKRREDGANLHERTSDATSRSMLNSGILKGAYVEGTEQALGRQKSVASRPETFSVSELAHATEDFSPESKVGWGSFGVVYRGRLSDGREVAVKRGHSRTKKSFQEKESAFESELGLLSRLHHKHLVSLLGFCEESDERLLVYEFMPNGSLHHHLHSGDGVVLSSWTERIRIALEAAKGLEYLHDYAVPPIIHRDIKSSNILLDSSWTAKVSDFGLSLAGPEAGQDEEFVSAKAVGTVGYIDPEYYVLNELTAKSDVYGLGVVMLELLTGKRAVFRDESGAVVSVVEYAARLLLDDRMGTPPVGGEARAVEVLAVTAMRCVRLQGCERPDMAEIVTELEKAFALCHS